MTARLGLEADQRSPTRANSASSWSALRAVTQPWSKTSTRVSRCRGIDALWPTLTEYGLGPRVERCERERLGHDAGRETRAAIADVLHDVSSKGTVRLELRFAEPLVGSALVREGRMVGGVAADVD